MKGRGKLVLALAALALWGTSAGLALAAPGELDGSFGAGGKSLVDLGGEEGVSAVALQPDGRIVAAGTRVAGGNYDMAVVRLLAPQGTLDASYGGGSGWSRLDFSPLDRGNAVALQPDGRIVVAGTISAGGGNSDGVVARLLVPQGTFDASYGGGSGWSRLDLGGTDGAYAVALQPDGRIVVAGFTDVNGTFDAAAARLLNPQGTFDPSFGGGLGWSRRDLGGSLDAGYAVALQPDGKIVVAGSTNANGSDDFSVVRLLPGGGLDDSFAGDGRSLVDFGGTDTGLAVALQPDGKIVVAGYSSVNGNDDVAVARLQPSGLLDTTFGTGGRSRVNFGGDDVGSAVALQPDGKIVVAGDSDARGNGDVAVVRLQGDPRDPGVAAGPPKCAGRRATIVGTAGRNVLRGTRRADVIAALGGNDVVRGAGGNDLVCAGPGNDRLFGGTGADRLFGNSGADRLFGGTGADRLFGNSGADRLFGGIGADRLFGGPGVDRLRGDFGRDLLRGGPGRDSQRQ